MADLCGGHPADVLIAVCLAAQALTVPGRQGWGEVPAGCWAGGDGAVLLGKLPGWRPSAGEGRREDACVCPRARVPVPGWPHRGDGVKLAYLFDGGSP